jgi:hypothetical protein
MLIDTVNDTIESVSSLDHPGLLSKVLDADTVAIALKRVETLRRLTKGLNVKENVAEK